MDYEAKANMVSAALSNAETLVTSINGGAFEGVWSGAAHDNLVTNLDDAKKKLDQQFSQVKNYVEVLNLVSSYKTTKEKRDNLINEKSSMELLNETDPSSVSRLNDVVNEINGLSSNLDLIKAKINALLGSISTMSSTLREINYVPEDTYSNYLMTIENLVTLGKSGVLTRLNDGSNLYDYYDEGQVNQYVNVITSDTSDVNEIVNAVMGLGAMSNAVGKELEVDISATYSYANDLADEGKQEINLGWIAARDFYSVIPKEITEE